MSAISKQALVVDNSQSFPNNNAGAITPTALRNFNTNMIDSNVNQTEYNTNSGSWNVSISNLNTFTASQQPTFTALNSFTASQLVINTGVNSFTQSATGRLNNLESTTSSLNTFSASINQIQSNGVLLGTSVRFNLVGSGTFFSASLTPNVNGAIATLTFTSDNGKTNTSSFNPFTASINTFTASANVSITNINTTTASLNTSVSNLNAYTASQNTFNSSITASVGQLLALSSSLSGGYATQGELDASSSTLQANINTKLNTSSFNDYTASQTGLNTFTSSINSYTGSNNTKWATIGLLTGSYATTGSNSFIGNQNISGSLTITGSAYGNAVSVSIVSNTASVDLTKGNYFTLLIASNTNINVINPQPCVTATLIINTAGATTASFSSNVKQSSGSVYVPSNSGSIDILSFTAVTTSSVFVIPAYSFV